MYFDNAILDDIRARLLVSQVVGRKVKLTRHGREFTGLSPFKVEKTPSFTVNDEKGFYHCFATAAHGDIFKFLMETEGLSFKESVETLAAEAGISLPQETKEQKVQVQKRDILLQICEQSCQFFQNQLEESQGAQARHYLRERQLEQPDYASFRVGFAPEGNNLLRAYLLAKGFSESHMIEAGVLSTSPKDKTRSYDRFRNRITFPIMDLKNNVIGFGARALDKTQKAKYLNSPESDLFHKGSLLYNGASARQAAFKTQQIIIVEGYMDVIRVALSGFPNCVAPMGTALTPNQLQLLWRFAPEPVLCFDGDSAGTKAAIRAMESALPKLIPGHSLRFAFMPEGMDPDDLIVRQGQEAFANIIEKAKPLINVFWDHHIKKGRWDTPESKAQLEFELNTALSSIEDRSVKVYYERDIKNRIYHYWRKIEREKWTKNRARPHSSNGTFRPQNKGRAYGNKFGNSYSSGINIARSQSGLLKSALLQNTAQSNPQQQRELLLVGCLLNHSWLIENYFEDISRLSFKTDDLEQLRSAILEIYMIEAGNHSLDQALFLDMLKDMGLGRQVDKTALALTDRAEPYLRAKANHEHVKQSWQQLVTLQRENTEFEKERDLASQQLTKDNTEDNLKKLNSLKRQDIELEAGRTEQSQNKELDDDFLQEMLQRVISNKS